MPLLPLVLAVLLAPAPRPKPLPADSTREDTKQIQGTWALTGASDGGKPAKKDSVGVMMEVKDDTLVIKEKARTEKVTFKLNGKGKVKHIDLKPAQGPGRPETIQGLYKLEKDALTICFIMGGKGRPADFNDPKARTLTFKRVAAKK